MLYIYIDEVDSENKRNQFINDIINSNNKHIIQCYNKTISNIPEEQRYISSMTPTGFINGKDESRCYVKSPFQVIFFKNLFGLLIMNTDCEKVIEHMENREDYYKGYIQKIMILQVIQHIFCEMLIGGRKISNSVIFFEGANIRTNVQNDCSEFGGLLHEMVSKKTFMSQEMCYINGDGERKLCTVSEYIKEFLRILEI